LDNRLFNFSSRNLTEGFLVNCGWRKLFSYRYNQKQTIQGNRSYEVIRTKSLVAQPKYPQNKSDANSGKIKAGV